MKFYVGKKHYVATNIAVENYKIIDNNFHSFLVLQERRLKEQAVQRGSKDHIADVTQVMAAVDEINMKTELQWCNHFFWTIK